MQLNSPTLANRGIHASPPGCWGGEGARARRGASRASEDVVAVVIGGPAGHGIGRSAIAERGEGRDRRGGAWEKMEDMEGGRSG